MENTNMPVISAKDLNLWYGDFKALKGISLDVGEREITALIGPSGCGKSTFLKTLNRMNDLVPNVRIEGDVRLKGEDIFAREMQLTDLRRRVGMVFQKANPFPMSIYDNITYGPKLHGVRNKAELDELVESSLRGAALWDEVKDRLKKSALGLSGGQQQRLCIARALAVKPEVLLMDEPTSALTFKEVESLFKCVNDLREKGIGIIYITHRLAEVFELATHVAILRDGVVTLQGPVADFTREMLVKGLLPPNMDEVEQKEGCTVTIDYKNLKPVFELQKFSGYGFSNIDLKVYPGEILGVAGVVGAGRTELATTIFGRDRALGGKAILDGKDITGLSTEKVLAAGVNYVPEDRHLHGLFKISDVAANTTSAILGRREMGRFFLNGKREREVTQKYVDDFRTKVTGQDQLVGSLSGGNQQKVVIGRALSTKPKLVILDEPTRGIDAAARGDVYSIIAHLRDEGVAVLLISSDMEEIVELSDRAVTVYQGRINAEFQKCDINQDNLMAAAFGVTDGKKVEA